MKESTDTRGLCWLLGTALFALAGSGCATLSAATGPGYTQSMDAADVALRGDDAAAAILAYRDAADAAPEQSLPWLHIAELHAGLGDWPQAVAASREVLERDPDDAVARDFYLRGSIQLVDDALQYLSEDDASSRAIAGELLAKLIAELGDDAIPLEVRSRLEAGVHAHPRRSSTRPGSPRPAPKAPEKAAADPLEVLGGG